MPGFRIMDIAIFWGDVEITQCDEMHVLHELFPDMLRNLFQPVQFVGVFFTADFLAIDDVEIQYPDTADGGAQDAPLRVVQAGDIGEDVSAGVLLRMATPL